jgi:hypothetical protein
MLFDRGFGDDQIGGDVPRRRRGDERLVGQGGTAQRVQYIDLAAGELGCDGPPQFDVRVDLLPGDAPQPTAGCAEADDIPVLQHPTGDRAPVDPGAVA